MAAPRTMILFDPDLDTDLSPQAMLPKRSGDASQPATLRGQRIPSRQTLARFLRDAQAAVKLRGNVSVLLTTDAAIRRLNRQFRGKNKATDVLSFPAASLSQVSKARPGAPRIQEIAGDLAISIPTARRQAEDRGHSLVIEIKVLMLHGLLHLAGYDHEIDAGQMARREQKLRTQLRLPHGLIERAHAGANGRPAKGPRR
jgi:probable rRNA maturation factor